MSLTLADLLVRQFYDDEGWLASDRRPATFDDLVEVAESLGGEIVVFDNNDWHYLSQEPGSYLVIPIPEKEAEE